jgi:phage shock protein PspC (stress-responsive transcriptional regulator)
MNKVTTINLNGNAYQVEESGYDAVRKYLDDATSNLGENEDKNEIILDLEQAIADKCSRFLTAHKNIILTSEIEEILKEMGPVQSQSEENKTDTNKEKEESKNEPKRLYRIREGAWLLGVCNGLAAYFTLDVTLVRLIFVGLTIITGGGWIIAYILMFFIVPDANTPQEKAAAFGVPFTAQEFVNRTKAQFENFKKKDWGNEKREWKEKKQRWKKEYELRKYEAKYKYGNNQRSPLLELIHAIFGLIWFAFLIVVAWAMYHYIPAVHTLFDQINIVLQKFFEQHINY